MLLCYCTNLTVGELRAACLAAKWPPAEKERTGKLCTGVSATFSTVCGGFGAAPRPDSRSTTSPLETRRGAIHLGRASRPIDWTVKSRSTRSRPARAHPPARFGIVEEGLDGGRQRGAPSSGDTSNPCRERRRPGGRARQWRSRAFGRHRLQRSQRKAPPSRGGHVEVAARVQICRPGDLCRQGRPSGPSTRRSAVDPGFLRSLTGQQEHDIGRRFATMARASTSFVSLDRIETRDATTT